MDDIIHKGELQCLMTGVAGAKEWHDRYYVLYRPTLTSQSRLDYYESEQEFCSNCTFRKSVYIDDITSISILTEPMHHRMNVLELNMIQGNHRKLFLHSSSRHDLNAWLIHIRKVKQFSRDDTGAHGQQPRVIPNQMLTPNDQSKGCSFRVEIVLTEAAKRCQLEGAYNLAMYHSHLELQDVSQGFCIYSWNYKHIRRYGRSSKSFTFEAGRKCVSGDGHFTFVTDAGDKIFHRIQSNTRSLSTSSMPSSDKNDAPPLPKRNYSMELEDSDEFSSITSLPETSPISKSPPGNYQETFSPPEPQEPLYAVYDVQGSSRFTKDRDPASDMRGGLQGHTKGPGGYSAQGSSRFAKEHDYVSVKGGSSGNAKGPTRSEGYSDTPRPPPVPPNREAGYMDAGVGGATGNTNLSNICAQLRNKSTAKPENYSDLRIDPTQQPANTKGDQRQHLYNEINSSQRHMKPTQTMCGESLYDEVCNNR